MSNASACLNALQDAILRYGRVQLCAATHGTLNKQPD
jgi:hypothetical protein